MKINIKNSDISGSPIGCNYISKVDFLDKSIKDTLEDIWDEIAELDDEEIKNELKIQYYQIRQFYEKETKAFLELIKYSSCTTKKEPSPQQIQNIIKFWLVAKYCDKSLDMCLISKLSGMFEFEGNSAWLFSPTKATSRSIEKSIAAMKEFLVITKSKNIVNGRCYLSKITHSKHFGCTKCTDGIIDLVNNEEIINDFVDGKKEPILFKNKVLQDDFVNIQRERNLVMKCGNCVTDIERIPDNLKKLVGES